MAYVWSNEFIDKPIKLLAVTEDNYKVYLKTSIGICQMSKLRYKDSWELTLYNAELLIGRNIKYRTSKNSGKFEWFSAVSEDKRTE